MEGTYIVYFHEDAASLEQAKGYEGLKRVLLQVVSSSSFKFEKLLTASRIVLGKTRMVSADEESDRPCIVVEEYDESLSIVARTAKLNQDRESVERKAKALASRITTPVLPSRSDRATSMTVSASPIPLTSTPSKVIAVDEGPYRDEHSIPESKHLIALEEKPATTLVSVVDPQKTARVLSATSNGTNANPDGIKISKPRSAETAPVSHQPIPRKSPPVSLTLKRPIDHDEGRAESPEILMPVDMRKRDKRLRCPQCFIDFFSSTGLAVHLEALHNPPAQCLYCDKKASEADIVRHMTAKVCPHCMQAFGCHSVKSSHVCPQKTSFLKEMDSFTEHKRKKREKDKMRRDNGTR